MEIRRSAGILLPVYALPSAYGIGSLGREARTFVKFLRDAGQTWWQVLPVGPVGAGNSPYSSESTFAGNPLLIDLELLAEDGLLTKADLAAARMPQAPLVDYPAVKAVREKLLRKAFQAGYQRDKAQVEAFAEGNPWVKNYALYKAAKERFGNVSWQDWPDKDLRDFRPGAVEQYRTELAEEIRYHTYIQYVFFQQWAELKTCANGLGVSIIGDLPIYVSMDSADVWSERKEFLLDSEGSPAKVAGVPPDYFSEEGQLWGNPLYDWTAMKADGFGWWIRRVEGAVKLFDAIRLDHFRAFESYWAVPAGEKTAKNGAWEKGPGMDLLRVLTGWFYQTTYIAEDLGILTDGVHQLREESGLPGMRVLEFAFSDPSNSYLPHNYPAHCVCYTGTHDNDTAAGWYAHAGKAEKAFADQYLGVKSEKDAQNALLRAGQGSVAQLFVAQLQDYLGLGSEARTNVPGVAECNWRWRLLPGQVTDALAEDIRAMTHTYGRC